MTGMPVSEPKLRNASGIESDDHAATSPVREEAVLTGPDRAATRCAECQYENLIVRGGRVTGEGGGRRGVQAVGQEENRAGRFFSLE